MTVALYKSQLILNPVLQLTAPRRAYRFSLPRFIAFMLFSLSLLIAAGNSYAAAGIPEWFKLSFLDLRDDLEETQDNGKKALILYFGQDDCGFCEKQLKVNWGDPEIVAYTQKHFEVVALDIRGNRKITDLKGKQVLESKYAHENKFHFTPTLVFIDLNGHEVFRLPGYRSAYQFKAVLEYVARAEYKTQSFRDYFARANLAQASGSNKLNEHKQFSRGPYSLARNKIAAKTKLVVSFEKPKCHACDVLHSEVLHDKAVVDLLKKLEAVQVDISKNSPVITPDGKHLKVPAWIKALEIDYTPNMVFFDEKGKEIMRMDSTSSVRRASGVLEYVLSNDYLKYPTFQAWRQNQRLNAVKK